MGKVGCGIWEKWVRWAKKKDADERLSRDDSERTEREPDEANGGDGRVEGRLGYIVADDVTQARPRHLDEAPRKRARARGAKRAVHPLVSCSCGREKKGGKAVPVRRGVRMWSATHLRKDGRVRLASLRRNIR